VVSFVSGDLRDLSISRTSFAWGVPVPDDPKHVMYVWLDALTNYITALGYPDTASDAYRTFWPASLHMVGKDIIRFHCVYWPAFLKAAGLEVPKRVFGTGWWTVEGEKMSKSLGNAIAPQTLVERYGVDALRFFMLRELPFGNDGDFSHRAVVGRINADLANGIGNLAQRVLSFIHKNAGAKVPEPGSLRDDDQKLLDAATSLIGEVRPCYVEQRFHHALELIWGVIGDADRYVDAEAPWTLRKTDPARMATVLFVLAEVIRHLAILLQPVMPDSAGRLLDQLAVPRGKRDFAALGSGRLVPGTPLPAPQGVFPRYVEAAKSA
jgi:methionyl-tRNA synthetase